jgi:hypothetical protein
MSWKQVGMSELVAFLLPRGLAYRGVQSRSLSPQSSRGATPLIPCHEEPAFSRESSTRRYLLQSQSPAYLGQRRSRFRPGSPLQFLPEAGGSLLRERLATGQQLDGKGYPAGLRGQQIPLGASIICVMKRV